MVRPVPRPRLVLVGCGHAHLFVLEALAGGRFGAVEAALVSPDDEYFYSGMVSGVMAGCYGREEARFRPPRLAHAAAAEWIRGRAVRIDPNSRTVTLEDGRTLAYDVLSLDIGARLAASATPGVAEHATPVKPIRRALEVLGEVRPDGSGRAAPHRVVVVGGGAAGVELAIGLASRSGTARDGGQNAVTLIEAGECILAEHTPRFRFLAATVLERRGVAVHTGVRVDRVEGGRIRAGDAKFDFDTLLWATGPAARPLPGASSLPTDRSGYLLVEPTLQCVDHPDIFGAGDCVTLRHAPGIARAGVYAVREGPVLADNLARRLRGDGLREYEPQRHWLSLMNTGDGRALLRYRRIALHSRAAWWLKDRIDRRFMRRFQRLEGEA
jgi:pyridine nucleotide-disulfide oxidoreductase family protein